MGRWLASSGGVGDRLAHRLVGGGGANRAGQHPLDLAVEAGQGGHRDAGLPATPTGLSQRAIISSASTRIEVVLEAGP